jgi:phosphate starvation-inducible PhoH-like protein
MEKRIKLETHQEACTLFGLHDENLKTIEKELKVKLTLRGESLKIKGGVNNIKEVAGLIEYLLQAIRLGQSELGKADLLSLISQFKTSGGKSGGAGKNFKNTIIDMPVTDLSRSYGNKPVGPKTKGQRQYVEAIKQYDIVFGIGPAGTGKTYLAMACAVEALKKQEVRRIVLIRPAIEAGESLGFLPGDMYEKISPYLRPLYDALYDMMDAERIEKYLDTFIILDEAQNCTAEQMKMFLTRLGFDSKAVITGDITQSDLPGGVPLGLLQAQDILKEIEGIQFTYFSAADVVRHELVQQIIEAYDKSKPNQAH